MSEKFLSLFLMLLAVTFLGVYTTHGSTIVKTKTRGNVCLTPYGRVEDGKSIYRKDICGKIECDAVLGLMYNWTCPTPPHYPDEHCVYLSKSIREYPKCCKLSLACT